MEITGQRGRIQAEKVEQAAELRHSGHRPCREKLRTADAFPTTEGPKDRNR